MMYAIHSFTNLQTFETLLVSELRPPDRLAGWDFVNEGTEDKPKKGYVATVPGSQIRLKVNPHF